MTVFCRLFETFSIYARTTLGVKEYRRRSKIKLSLHISKKSWICTTKWSKNPRILHYSKDVSFHSFSVPGVWCMRLKQAHARSWDTKGACDFARRCAGWYATEIEATGWGPRWNNRVRLPSVSGPTVPSNRKISWVRCTVTQWYTVRPDSRDTWRRFVTLLPSLSPSAPSPCFHSNIYRFYLTSFVTASASIQPRGIYIIFYRVSTQVLLIFSIRPVCVPNWSTIYF
jgi:hypothetical protein